MLKSKLNFALALALLFTSTTPTFGQDAAAKEEVAKLVAVLKSDASRKEKADACRELARIGTREAVAPLAALLGNEQLNHMARYGLETIPDPSVDTALRAALGRLRGRPLVGVVGSIGVRRDAQAVEPLGRFLSDGDPEVAQAAARALGKIGNPAAARLLAEALPNAPAANQVAFCEGLFRCAEALATNGQINDALVIYDRLRNQPAPQQVRMGALRGLMLTHRQASLRLLSQGLHSDDFVLAEAAVRSALEMPGTDVTQLLVNEVSQLPPETQVLVIQALGKRADAAALPVLVTMTKTGPKATRLAAVRALPEIGCVKALPTLLELMGNADREIAQAAQEGLAALPGKEVDNAVIAMVDSSESNQRLTGIDLIERRRMVACVPILVKAAQDTDAKIRPAALKRLGDLAVPADLPALVALLNEAGNPQDVNAAEQAVNAVCARMSNPESCADRLLGALEQAKPAQKCALLRILGSVGGPAALKAVREAVDSSNSEIHTTALRSLGAWKTVDAAPQLLALAKSAENATDKMLCLRNYLGWASHPEVSEAQRLSMCRQAGSLVQRDEEKKLLLGALGNIATPEAVTLITPYLANAATKEEASVAAVGIAEKLLKGANAARAAGNLVEPLQKVIEASANADLVQRAKTLLKQAQNKAAAQ